VRLTLRDGRLQAFSSILLLGLWREPPRAFFLLRSDLPAMRRYPSPYASSFSFGPGPLSTALKAIIGANVVMFFATTFFRTIVPVLGLVPALVIGRLWVWQVATYMFLHGGLFHILFNMLALWMFGTELERIWGTRYFLKFYFVSGIGAGVLTVLFSLMPFGFA